MTSLRNHLQLSSGSKFQKEYIIDMGTGKVAQKRILWIDYVKAIGIATIVLAHTVDYVLAYPLMSWIASFTVQLFFVISGYLTSSKDSIQQTFTKGIKGIIIPYISFHLLILVFFLISQSFMDPYFFNDFAKKIGQYLLGILLGEGGETPISKNLNTPLWFLPSLFFCKMILQSVIINKRYRNLKLGVIVIASIIATYYLHANGINLYFCFDSAIMGIPFYVLGFLLKEKGVLSKEVSSKGKLCLAAVILLIVSITTSHLNQEVYNRIDMNTLQYGKSLLLFYVTGCAGAMCAILFARLFEDKSSKFLSYIGQNTLIILGTHYMHT